MMKDSNLQKKVLIGVLAAGTGAAVYYGYARWKSRSDAKPADDQKAEADDKQGSTSGKSSEKEVVGASSESKLEPVKDTKVSEEPVLIPHLQGPASLSRPNSVDTNHGSDALSLSGSFEKVSLTGLQERQNSTNDNLVPGQKSPSESFEKITLPPVSPVLLNPSSAILPQSESDSKDVKSDKTSESKEDQPGISVSDMRSRFESAAASAADSTPRQRTEIKMDLPGVLKPQEVQNMSSGVPPSNEQQLSTSLSKPTDVKSSTEEASKESETTVDKDNDAEEEEEEESDEEEEEEEDEGSKQAFAFKPVNGESAPIDESRKYEKRTENSFSKIDNKDHSLSSEECEISVEPQSNTCQAEGHRCDSMVATTGTNFDFAANDISINIAETQQIPQETDDTDNAFVISDDVNDTQQIPGSHDTYHIGRCVEQATTKIDQSDLVNIATSGETQKNEIINGTFNQKARLNRANSNDKDISELHIFNTADALNSTMLDRTCIEKHCIPSHTLNTDEFESDKSNSDANVLDSENTLNSHHSISEFGADDVPDSSPNTSPKLLLNITRSKQEKVDDRIRDTTTETSLKLIDNNSVLPPQSESSKEIDGSVTKEVISDEDISLGTQKRVPGSQKEFEQLKNDSLAKSESDQDLLHNGEPLVEITKQKSSLQKSLSFSGNRTLPHSIPENDQSLSGSAALFSIGGDDLSLDSLSPDAISPEIFKPGSPIGSYTTPFESPKSPKGRRSPFVIRSPKVLWKNRTKSPSPGHSTLSTGSLDRQSSHPGSPMLGRSASSFSRKSSTASVNSLFESSSDLEDLENVASVMLCLYKHLPQHDEEPPCRRLRLAFQHPVQSGKLVDLGASLSREGENNGHVVDSVEPGSLAQEIGLSSGDTLIAINNMDVTNWKPDVVTWFMSKVSWDDLELIKKPGYSADSKKNIVQHVTVNLSIDGNNIKADSVIVEQSEQQPPTPIELGDFNPKGCVIQMADRGRCLALKSSTLCALEETSKHCEMMRLLYSRPGSSYKTPVTMLAFFGEQTIQYICAVDSNTVQIMNQNVLTHSIQSLKYADCRFFYHRFIGGHHCFEAVSIPDHYIAVDKGRVGLKHLESTKQVSMERSVLFDVHYKPVNTTK